MVKFGVNSCDITHLAVTLSFIWSSTFNSFFLLSFGLHQLLLRLSVRKKQPKLHENSKVVAVKPKNDQLKRRFNAVENLKGCVILRFHHKERPLSFRCSGLIHGLFKSID